MSDESHFNEEAFSAAFAVEPEPVEVVDNTPEPVTEDVTPEPEQVKPEVNDEEAKASQRGWTSKAEWVAQGKDPDEWVSAKHFNEKGTLISKAREFEALQKTFKADVDNVKKYVQAQAQMQIQQLQQQNAELLEAKRQAVNYGDWDGVQKAEQALTSNAINQLNLQQQMQQPNINIPSEVEAVAEAQFERENPWVGAYKDPANPDYGKSIYAQNFYQQLLQNPNMDVHQRLQIVQAEIAQKFPPKAPTNPNRDKPGITDSKPSGKLTGDITWADLNKTELSEWQSFGEMMFNGDKKAFLKAVKNSRG
jgi:hypothetical protein